MALIPAPYEVDFQEWKRIVFNIREDLVAALPPVLVHFVAQYAFTTYQHARFIDQHRKYRRLEARKLYQHVLEQSSPHADETALSWIRLTEFATGGLFSGTPLLKTSDDHKNVAMIARHTWEVPGTSPRVRERAALFSLLWFERRLTSGIQVPSRVFHNYILHNDFTQGMLSCSHLGFFKFGTSIITDRIFSDAMNGCWLSQYLALRFMTRTNPKRLDVLNVAAQEGHVDALHELEKPLSNS